MSSAVPITELHEQVDDVLIGYQRYGDGPTYMLGICGAVGCYKKDWPENVLRAFDPHMYTIVCLDPPGYGTSRPPDRKQEVNRAKKDAKYCIGLMKQLHLTPFVVMGWSEGARTAVHVAVQGAQVVNRVILMAASTRADARGDQGFQGIRDTDQWTPEMRQKYLDHCTNDFLKEQWAALCDVIHEVFLNYGGRFPSDLILHQIKQPTLLMYGGTDKFIIDQTYFKTRIPHIQQAVHATAGHQFYAAHPRWFAIRVAQFLDGQPRPA